MPKQNEIPHVGAVYFVPRSVDGQIMLTRPKGSADSKKQMPSDWEHSGKGEGFNLPVDVFIKIYKKSPELAWLLAKKFHAQRIPFSEKWWEGGSGKVDDDDADHRQAAEREMAEEWQLENVTLTNTLEPSTHPHAETTTAFPAIMQFRRGIGLLKLATIHGFSAWLNPTEIAHLETQYEVSYLPTDPALLEAAVIQLIESDELRPFTALLLAYFLTFPETFAQQAPTTVTSINSV